MGEGARSVGVLGEVGSGVLGGKCVGGGGSGPSS